MIFYLGTHDPGWLGRLAIPLMISHRRLNRRKRLPRARASWVLDSGGFSELSLFGRWETLPGWYAARAERYRAEIGLLAWAAPQDWICEPEILRKTGRTVRDHQCLTVESVVGLRARAPSVPWAPVLQGWRVEDYLRCAELYEEAGIGLRAEPVVGVGSVCRRQGTREAVEIFTALNGLGLRLHGFGLKTTGLRRCARLLASADSLAWSFRARRSKPLRGCAHASCANCPRFARLWRRRVLALIGRPLPTYFPW